LESRDPKSKTWQVCFVFQGENIDLWDITLAPGSVANFDFYHNRRQWRTRSQPEMEEYGVVASGDGHDRMWTANSIMFHTSRDIPIFQRLTYRNVLRFDELSRCLNWQCYRLRQSLLVFWHYHRHWRLLDLSPE
jgi:hypothetical protein